MLATQNSLKLESLIRAVEDGLTVQEMDGNQEVKYIAVHVEEIRKILTENNVLPGKEGSA